MTDLHNWFFASWLILYLTMCTCDSIVQYFEGESATLACKYDSQYHGKCHICWIKGEIPNMGCGEELIGSDGDKVVRRKSVRYHLTGDIQHGDVSLTISNIQKKDSGKYGCRIHVPGWFNDEMYYVNLIVKDAPTTTTQETMASTTPARETTVFTSAMTEGIDRTEESSRIFSTSESSTIGLWHSITFTTHDNVIDYHNPSLVVNKESWNTSVIIVPVLLLLLAVLVIAVILIWKKKRKSRAGAEITQNLGNSVIYNNSGSSVGLYSREMAVDNIYQVETESEYEQWH